MIGEQAADRRRQIAGMQAPHFLQMAAQRRD